MPFAKVSATLERMLGFKQSVHTLERNQREMAQAAPAFWREQPTPAAEQEGALRECTADGKGVPMRGAGEGAPAAGSPTRSGRRPGTKKMALIASVYSVDRPVRTPEEVLKALFRESPLANPRRHAPTPVSSTCGRACNAMRRIVRSHRPKRSSVGLPSRWPDATPRAKNWFSM
jgi:hypothetical protein